MAETQESKPLKQTEEQIELQKSFEEEIKKPYYDVFYLDNFKLPYEKLDVSIVIPTYNRCPYKPDTMKEDMNPLVWAIKTALMQKPKIKEIVIADDCSTDYTKELVEKYQRINKGKDLPEIIYVRSDKKVGASVIRNVGSKKTTGKFLFFTDDDMFMSPYSAFGGIFTFNWLKDQGINVGIVNLPFYSRSSIPNKIVKKSEIARVSFLRGEYTGNKNAFPLEYVSPSNNNETKFIHNELHLLKPLQIENSGGFFICEKDVFMKIGGFPDNIVLRGEDREFGFRYIENGYTIYLTPDIKIHGVHGSYGLKTGKKFEGVDWFIKLDKSISLKKAMEICDDPKTNTGARINPKDFIYDGILSFFILVYIRNKKSATKWIKKVDKEFVKDGSTSLFTADKILIPDEKGRKEILIHAINHGLNFIINLEKTEIKKMKKAIEELKKDHELNENVFNILEEK